MPLSEVSPQPPVPGAGLKIATANIERSKHLSRVQAFLQAEQPDVVCFQEIAGHDIPLFTELFGGPQNFVTAGMTQGLWEESPQPQTMNLAIASRHGLSNVTTAYYHGSGNPLPAFTRTSTNVSRESISHVLLCATVGGFRIGCTHLTWTQDGLSTPEQQEDATNLIAAAQAEAAIHGGLMLAGDFNAPRGRATWAMLAEAFTDNIPASITTSLDGSLHRAGQLPYVVDGLFTTPNYHLANVIRYSGVSDHHPFTATLS